MKRWAALVVVLAACSGTPEVAPTAATVVASSAPTTSTAGASDASDKPETTVASTSTTALAPLDSLSLEPVEIDVGQPVQVIGGPDRVTYVVDKAGRIVGLDGSVVLDIASLVRNRGEQGLLSAAFEGTDRLVVHYTDGSGDTVIAAYEWIDGQATSPVEILSLSQPAANHNGGMITFGPDGSLYVGLGDGGAADDRFGNGQNLDTLLGTIIRISLTDNGYVVPPDNPELGGEVSEIWAYGLRNPWRFWIDGETMVIADVGQNRYEEIDVVPLQPAGWNFGWPITEGLHCFSPSAGCDTAGQVLPVVETEHGDAGTCSITGGVVYRGDAIGQLDGVYLYSDYCGGYLRGFPIEDPSLVTDYTEMVGGPMGAVTSFGVGGDGEVYVTTSNAVFRLTR